MVGVCEQHIASRTLPDALKSIERFDNFETALSTLKPDAVSINTPPDTHAQFAIMTMAAGAHAVVEKPLADTAENAERAVATARRTGKKLVVGYIRRQHPSWIRVIEIARQLGTPLVFRMNLNQQSNGETAFFMKDVIGPKGSVSIVMAETAGNVKSDDTNAHTKTNQILSMSATNPATTICASASSVFY